MRNLLSFLALLSTAALVAANPSFSVNGDLLKRQNDSDTPLYKDPNADIEDRVKDLLGRMSLEEKVAQIIQGDMNGWMNFDDPNDNTLTYNQSGLEAMMAQKAGTIWGGYLTPWEKFEFGVRVGQEYLVKNTTLGIPALFQSEGLHGFTNNGTTFPSPLALAASFNPDLVSNVSSVVAKEAAAVGVRHIFAPVLDLGREVRWGRVEEGFGEDPFLSGELGLGFVRGLQGTLGSNGTTGNSNSTGNGTASVAATCKHFAAFGSPQGGLNLAPVPGGERELRMSYLRPFRRACLEAMSIMTAYSSYDGVPVVDSKHILTEILREEWGYKYYVTTDAGSVDRLYNAHFTCESRECAAKRVLENGLSGEMGGGTYTYLTLPDQIRAGNVSESALDTTVASLLRTKFAMGLFENPYPTSSEGNFTDAMRTPESREIEKESERESLVLLQNDGILPLDASKIGSIAMIGPFADRVNLGDYVFAGAELNSISPLKGVQTYLSNVSSGAQVKYAKGVDAWSNDQSGVQDAVSAAQGADVAVVVVGTWSLDQQHLWAPTQPGVNATTGEHVDLSSLALVGAQLPLIQAIKQTGVKTVVVFTSGKPIAEPWIKDNANAVVQQFYPGEYGGGALAEVLFGAVNPSGKLPISFPRSVGTAPAFYDYLKGARPVDAGMIAPDGTMLFGHQYVLDSPVPLWSFGHGLSYTTFNYTNMELSSSSIGADDTFTLTVTVTNTGSRDGKEVVQVYMTDDFASVVTPNQQLVAFKKVDIKAGQSSQVSMDIRIADEMAVWTLDNKFVVEPGSFTVRIGTSEEAFLTGSVSVR